MPQPICRCGQVLTLANEQVERITCEKCGARIRVRRPGGRPSDELRFHCVCGRRLKVLANPSVTHGRCPECGRVVPVPRSATPEAPTVDLSPEQVAALQAWAERHEGKGPEKAKSESRSNPQPRAGVAKSGGGGGGGGGPSTPQPGTPAAAVLAQTASGGKAEIGLRVCPKCGKPVHIAAESCRNCGSPVPRR